MKLLIVTQAVDKQDPVLGFFHEWLMEFAKHTEELTVLALRVGEYDLPAHVTVVPLRTGPRNRMATIGTFLHELYVRRASYDTVFVHMNPEYVLLGGPVWRILGKPIILWYTHKHVGLRLRLAELLVTRILTASKESLRLKSKKVLIMGHGIAMPYVSVRQRTPDQTLHIATVGRIAPVKRIHELVQALGSLDSQKIPFICSIVGIPVTAEDVVYARNIERDLLHLPYRERVLFKGAIRHENLFEILTQTDVFVNLSLTGSLDKAVLEALACRVPVVSSNEAFESLLRPAGLFIDTVDEETIAGAIIRAQNVDMHALSDTVRKTHSLSELVPAILKVL